MITLQNISAGLSFHMPAGKLFNTSETAHPDSAYVTPPYQLPVIAGESFNRPTRKQSFLRALFGR